MESEARFNLFKPNSDLTYEGKLFFGACVVGLLFVVAGGLLLNHESDHFMYEILFYSGLSILLIAFGVLIYKLNNQNQNQNQNQK